MGDRNRLMKKHERGHINSHQSALQTDPDETTKMPLSYLCQTKVPWFGDIRVYTAVFTLLSITCGMYWGYMSGVLAFIEIRYHMSSSMSGFILSSPEIGRLALLLFTSHFGNRFNKARVVGVSYTLVGIAVFGQTLPHYLIKPYPSTATTTLGNVTDFPIHTLCTFNSSVNDNLSTPDEGPGRTINTNAAYGIFVAFCMMMGASASSYFGMGLGYIEDNSQSTQAGKLIGYTGTGWAFGQLFGMLLAAWCATIYVDNEATSLTPEDPAWIGAWWLGLLIISTFQFLIAPLFCCFPKHIPVKTVSKEKKTEMELQLSSVPFDTCNADSDSLSASHEARTSNMPLTKIKKPSVDHEMKVKYDFKGLLKALVYLLTNPVYTTLVFGFAISNLHVSGFYAFLPKYTETQFSISAPAAILSVGLMTGIGTGLASLFGGQIITWLKLETRGVFLMLLTLSVIGLASCVSTIFLGCDSTVIDGVSNTDSDLPLMSCTTACRCDLTVYEPVCDNGLTYFSPCHAGCVTHNITEEGPNSMFLSCECTESGTALQGACSDDCKAFIPFMVFGSGMFLAHAAIFVAVYLLVFRVVPKCYASLSIGVSTMANALFGWMPGVALYGAVIDTTCSVWEETSSGETGFCWIYDLPAFRYKVMGLNTGCFAVLLLFSFISFMLHRRKMYAAV